jgi:TPR repeat protein
MIKFLCLTLSFGMFLLCPAMGLADALSDGNQAEDRGDYAGAFNAYLASAQQGNEAGEFMLAGLYLTGRGIGQNCKQAIYWYDQAARQGAMPALLNIGLFNEKGICMPENDVAAVKIFTVLAQYGNAKAQSELAHIYNQGIGVGQDFGKAAGLYTQAANQNDANAQANLGLLYMYGQGEPQDDVQAYKWLTLGINNTAGANHDSNWTTEVGYFNQQLHSLSNKMTSAEIALAKSLAATWMPTVK